MKTKAEAPVFADSIARPRRRGPSACPSAAEGIAMEHLPTGSKLANLGRYLKLAQSCRDDSEHRSRGLVVARGRYDDLALVPLATDGKGSFGCPDVRSMVLLRTPWFLGEDDELAAVVAAAGGCLRLATTFDDDGVREAMRGAGVVVAWREHKVFRVIDGAARHAERQPVRLVADSCAPDYGRWPAPSLPWVSVAGAIRWDTSEPFRSHHRRGGGTKLRDAIAAVGLPPLGPQEQALTKELAIASLIRSTPWTEGPEPPHAYMVCLARPVMSVVGICQGRVYRLDADGCWRPLFRGDDHEAGVRLLEIEQATAHIRMADTWAWEKGLRGLTS